MSKTVRLLLGLIATFALAISPVLVRAAGGIKISPLSYDFELKPGTSDEFKIEVTNFNSTDLHYVVEVEDFNKVSDDGAPSFSDSPDTDVNTLKDWISLKNPEDVESTLKPSEMKTIDFSIAVPADAEPGGHYAAVFAKEIKDNSEGKSEIGVSSRVGTLILVSVPGNVSKSAEIKNFVFPKIIWRTPAPDFTLKVANTGTVHYDSTAKVELTSLLGKKQTVDLGTHTIIPGNERNFAGSWGNNYPFGSYKVVATATDGNGNTISTEAGLLWALPLIIIIPILVLIIVLWIVIAYLRRNFKLSRKNPEQSQN